jgi:hypothetical protein
MTPRRIDAPAEKSDNLDPEALVAFGDGLVTTDPAVLEAQRAEHSARVTQLRDETVARSKLADSLQQQAASIADDDEAGFGAGLVDEAAEAPKAEAQQAESSAPSPEKRRRSPRRRSTKKAASDEAKAEGGADEAKAEGDADEAKAEGAKPAPRRPSRPRRSRAKKTVEAEGAETKPETGDAKPAKPAAKKADASPEPAPSTAEQSS